MAKGKKKTRKSFKPWEFSLGASAMAVDSGGGGEGESSAPAVPSKGVLQKQQRWEIKALKVRISNLQKEKLKLSKKEPQQKEQRKALEKQIKMMLEEQKQAHESQLQELQRLKEETVTREGESEGEGQPEMETSDPFAEARTSQDVSEPAENATPLLEVSEDQEGSRGEGAMGAEDMDMEESGVQKFKLGRKSLAKRMKKKMKAQKKRAWHLIAKGLGVHVQDRSPGSAKRRVGIKIRKKLGRKRQVKTNAVKV